MLELLKIQMPNFLQNPATVTITIVSDIYLIFLFVKIFDISINCSFHSSFTLIDRLGIDNLQENSKENL